MNLFDTELWQKLYKRLHIPLVSLIFNCIYALFNFALGIFNRSFWFVTMGVYYLVLSVLRYGCSMTSRQRAGDENFIVRFIGVMLLIMCASLLVAVILTKNSGIVSESKKAVSLAVAIYTGAKIIMAIFRLIKARGHSDCIRMSLLGISFADAVSSLLTARRLFLIGRPAFKRINILTEVFVLTVIFIYAVYMLKRPARES